MPMSRRSGSTSWATTRGAMSRSGRWRVPNGPRTTCTPPTASATYRLPCRAMSSPTRSSTTQTTPPRAPLRSVRHTTIPSISMPWLVARTYSCTSPTALAADREITGPVTVGLWASTSAPSTDFTAKLIQVRPDGMTIPLCQGIVRTSGGEGRVAIAGAVYRYEISLSATSVVVRAGDRLRLDVSSSEFPTFEPNPNTGGRMTHDAETAKATQRIFHDALHPSTADPPRYPPVTEGVPMTVSPARLQPIPEDGTPSFAPYAADVPPLADLDYIQEEWIATGIEDGRAYATSVCVRRPRDDSRFSGTVIVEPLHVHGIAPIWIYTAPYLLRAGHAWVEVTAQKTSLDMHVKQSNPKRYENLNIEGPDSFDFDANPCFGDSEASATFWSELIRRNRGAGDILAQTGAAIRGPEGPFREEDVRNVILAGHSQTGSVTSYYIQDVTRQTALGRRGCDLRRILSDPASPSKRFTT